MGHAPEFDPPVGRQLWAALISLALGGFLLLAYVLWTGYREIWSETQTAVRSDAALIEAHFEATLRRLDSELVELAEGIGPEMLRERDARVNRGRIEAALERHRVAFPEVAGFRVIDAAGDVVYVAGGGSYAKLADRSYFTYLKAHPEAPVFFSEVLVSRITGGPVIVAARAIRAGDGRFIGVASAAVDLGYFEQLFRGVPLGQAGVLAIRRTDSHALVSRYPQLPQEINRPLRPDNPVARQIAGGEREGVVEAVSQSDGVRRIYAFRLLERYPFYIVAGLAKDDVMATWARHLAIVGALGAGLFASLCLVLLWLFRAQRRELLSSDAIRRQQEQLTAAQRIARLGSWAIDLATRKLACSDEFFRIFEVTPSDGGVSFAAFFSVIHPEDREMMEQMLAAARSERRPVSIRHRLCFPDGRIKYLNESCEAVFAPDGAALRIIGTAQDITDQHHMEARMQLLVSAFQFSGEAIVITDRDNHIVTVNPAFTLLTGYESAEAIGRDPRFLSAGRTTPEEYERMWHGILEKGFWQGEIWDRRKDGATYPKWMSISVIRDEQGAIRYHVAHFTDVSSEHAAEAKLHHMAHHDVLTGLVNRFSLMERLDQVLATARREGTRVALLFIDLDRFKNINDTLGHHLGDRLLIEVAARLREILRDSDVVARLGGDEFVIMLSGVDHAGAVARVAEKIVASIGDPYSIEGHDLYTTPSIGIALFPGDGEDRETLMKNADAAMYHAKSFGRNNFQFFDSTMNEAALDRLKIEQSLRHALARGEFCLHFQPIINVATGRVAAVEALVRWQHPTQGLLMPGRFIAVAEETGLIQPLGDWVFWAACKQLADFAAQGIGGVKMSVNISAIQIRNGNLPVLAKGAIEAFALNPGELVFEITESVAMHQPAETVRILDTLHEMGIGLAIDDFGTGYSSLSYLRLFPIDHLKLDRSFVEEIGQDGDGAIICDATIGLAHNLGLKVIAEGVETQEQTDYLHRQGCDLMQGYLYSRPIPADEVIAFIRRRNA